MPTLRTSHAPPTCTHTHQAHQPNNPTTQQDAHVLKPVPAIHTSRCTAHWADGINHCWFWIVYAGRIAENHAGLYLCDHSHILMYRIIHPSKFLFFFFPPSSSLLFSSQVSFLSTAFFASRDSIFDMIHSSTCHILLTSGCTDSSVYMYLCRRCNSNHLYAAGGHVA